MLQHYYATEKPLPLGKALHRMLRATDKAERAAIDAIAAGFWHTTAEGLVNDRANEEITKSEQQAEVNRSIALAREARKGARTEHEPSTNRSTNRSTKRAREPDEPSTNRSTNDEPNHSHSHSQKDTNTVPTALVVEPPEAPHRPACPTDEIVALYHRHLPMLPRVEILNDARRKHISSRWREVVCDGEIAKGDNPKTEALEWFGWYFEHASKSPFLTGKSKDWRASFDFLMAPTNFAKVAEGNYHRSAA